METKYYYHFDGLGSVVALSNNNGQVVERYSYDVFGEPNRVSAVGNPYMFTGREYDNDIGLYYYRFRYYHPQLGRFLQTDPIGYYAGEKFCHDYWAVGSCVWDMGSYDGNLYAVSLDGLYKKNLNDNDWAFISNSYKTSNMWEMEALGSYLYVSAGPKLYRHNGTSYDPDYCWQGDGNDIISMISNDLNLFIGTGAEAGYKQGTFGPGSVYKYDGITTPELIGTDLGTGVQALLVTEVYPPPDDANFIMTIDNNTAGCVEPGNEIKYTIHYELPPGARTRTNVKFTDFLPDAVDFISAPGHAVYDPDLRTVMWYFAELSAGDSNNMELTVKVNTKSQPGGKIVNVVGAECDDFVTSEPNEICVAWWANNNIIYVSPRGKDYNGSSWEYAYTDLQQALNHAEHCSGDVEIWVAAGTYYPGTWLDEDVNKSFEMLEDVNLYGGFAGFETSIDQRDLTDPANETVLDGRDFFNLVVIGADEAALDGFTVRGGLTAGVYCNQTSPIIRNCVIESNGANDLPSPPFPLQTPGGGICYYNASPTIENNKIRANRYCGILCDGAGSGGLIRNNWIYSNKIETSYSGMWICNCSSALQISNNTVTDNYRGVYQNAGTAPNIYNCIIYRNGSNSIDDNIWISGFENYDYSNVNYCCIGGLTFGGTNIDADPCFVDAGNPDPNLCDYHLKSTSLCIDTGNPAGSYSGQTDIDGDPRKLMGKVGSDEIPDMGADEYTLVRVEAGLAKIITMPTNPVELQMADADLTCDGLVSLPTNLSVEWGKLSGPNNVNFSEPNGLIVKTTAQFTQAGTYSLKLSAKAGGKELDYDTVTVKVNIGVEATSDPNEIIFPDNDVNLIGSYTGGAPNTIQWSSPSSGVTINPSGTVPPATAVTATFAAPGVYVLLLEARDSGGNVIGFDTVPVTVKHQQLTVHAGADEQIKMPGSEIDLAGAVTGGVPARTEWVFIGPQEVNFNDSGSLSTQAQFALPGVYDIALLAKDNQDSVLSADTLKVTVESDTEQQMIVYAGTDKQINLHAGSVSAILCGGIADGNWSSAEWVFADTTATVTFNNISALDSWVKFNDEGVYRLGLLAKNGTEIIGVDTIEITFNDPCTAGGLPPYGQAVNIAGNTEVNLPATLLLSADITGSYNSIQWVADSRVNFANNGVNTTVTFDEAGVYSIGLVVKNDTNLVGVDSNIVIVYPVNQHQLPVDAGDDTEITLPDNDVNLSATVNSGYNSLQWIDPTSGMVTFNNQGQLNTEATFADAGKYAISLLAKDAEDRIIGRDSVIIIAGDGTLVVDAGIDIYLPVDVNLSRFEPVTVPMKGTVTGLKKGQTTHWELEKGPANMITINDANDPRTTVQIRQFNCYTLQLQVKENGNVVDQDNVTIAVFPSSFEPIVYAGRDKVGRLEQKEEGVSLQISLGDSWIWPGQYEITPVWDHSPSQDVNFIEDSNGIVNAIFYDAGVYTLTLSAENADDHTTLAYDTVNVTVYDAESGPIVYGGNPQTVEMKDVNGVAVAMAYLNDFTIIPMAKGLLTFNWQLVSKPPSADEPNLITDGVTATPWKPIAIFYYPGNYKIGLDVNQPPWPVVHREVTITVVESDGSPDLDNPTITLALTNGGLTVDPCVPVCGLINVNITAEDLGSGIATLELGWKGGQNVLIKQISSVPPTCPRILQLNYTINTYYLDNNEYILYAKVVDAAGNGVEITRSFRSTGPSTNEPPIAAITNSIFYEDIMCQVPKDAPLALLKDGTFILKGSAYHPEIADNVEYKVDLFKPQIKAMEPSQWNNPDYLLHRECFVKTLFPNDGNDWATGRITKGTLGTLDFSGVENGTYQMLLTVRNPGTTKYSHAHVGFVLDCPLKIGNLQFSQEDMVIPVAGIPLIVTRTYNSLQRQHDSEFGYGWSYSISGMDIELNELRVPFEPYEDLGSTSAPIRWCSNYDRNVTLTLPDGTRATFLFYLKWHTGNLYEGELPYRTAEYASPPGVNAKLETSKEEKLTTWGLWEGQGYGINCLDDPDMYDFSGYVLTTEDGTKYVFERYDYLPDDEGDIFDVDGIPYWAHPRGEDLYLSKIISPSGEWTDFNVDLQTGKIGMEGNAGIQSYDVGGQVTKTVQIEYAGSRISKIWAPGENKSGPPTLEYKYDSNGNLTEVHKLVRKDDPATPENELDYDVTKYVYGSGANCGGGNPHISLTDHCITGIKDPRGITTVSYVYDNAYRLIAAYDAKCNSIDINHNDPNHPSSEVVSDRYGNTTVYKYNSRGGVEAATNALNQTTLYFYDDQPNGEPGDTNYDPRNPDKPTEVRVPLVENPDPCDANDYSITKYQYDDQGRPWRITDPNNNVTEYDYDAIGNVLESRVYKQDTVLVSKTVNTYNVRYEDRNLLETVENKDPSGTTVEKTEYYYDSKNRITDVNKVDPCGVLPQINVTHNEYDKTSSNSPDQPYSVTDAAGSATYFQYDAKGNQTHSWYYWDDGLPTPVDYCKVTTITEYDDAGRVAGTLRQISETGGSIDPCTVVLSETAYNKIGKVDTAYDQFGNYTQYDYDELGNLVETQTYDATDSLLTVSRTLYDKEGRVLVSVGPYDADIYSESMSKWPVGTENVYDELGRIVETRRWAGVKINTEDIIVDSVVVGKRATGWTSENAAPVAGNELSNSRTEYDVGGRVWKTYQQDETGTEHCINECTYDKAGKQIEVKTLPGTADEAVTETHYNGTQRDWIKDARNNTTSFAYDAIGRLIRTTCPATAQNPITYIHVEYDGLGRKSFESQQTSETNPENAIGKTFEYDHAGRLSRVWLPEVIDPCTSQYTEPNYVYEYDTHGNMVLQQDPSGKQTRFNYDYMNNQTLRELPGGETEYKDYDVYGRLVKHTDFDGHVAGYVYDDADRGLLSKVRYYDNEAAYQANHPTGTCGLEIAYTYDNLGRKETETINGTQTWMFYYDAEGKVEYVDSPQGIVGYEYYLATGSQKSVFTPDSVGSAVYSDKVTFTYDSLGRLFEVKAEKRNGTTINEITQYAYNSVGSLYTVLYPNGITSTYDYDALNRLTSMTNTRSGSTLSSYTYAIADDGTRTSVTEADGSTYSWQYDNLNRLTQEIYDGATGDYTHDYTYDLVGNRLTKKVNGALAVTYQYDSAGNNRLMAEDNTSGNDVSYEYYNGGMLKKKTVGASVTDYGYDLRGRLTSVSGAVSSTYSYNPDGIRVSAGNTTYLIDSYNHTGYAQVFKETMGGTSTIYTIGSDVISQGVGAGSPTYFIYDGHGSVRQHANSSGTVTNTFNYDAYGNAVGFTPTNGLYYTGEMYNVASETYYLRTRDYRPDIGRLMTQDVYPGDNEDPISLHKYLYCNANPINFVDPEGLFTEEFGYLAEDAIQGIYRIDHPFDNVSYGGWTRLGEPLSRAFRLKPDILNYTKRTWLEIKPLTISGVAKAGAQYKLYDTVFSRFKYEPEVGWTPSTHFTIAGRLEIFFFNAGGIVFYTDIYDSAEDLLALTSYQAAKTFMLSPAGLRVGRGLLGVLSKVPGLVNARVRIDETRFQGHLNIGFLFAGAFGVL